MLSDHRRFRALSVPVENQETNTYPKAAVDVSMLVPSISHAKFKSRKNANVPCNPQLCEVFNLKITHSIPRRPSTILLLEVPLNQLHADRYAYERMKQVMRQYASDSKMLLISIIVAGEPRGREIHDLFGLGRELAREVSSPSMVTTQFWAFSRSVR